VESISVVIPAYNCEVSLPLCLESLQQQDFVPAEIIVVDDGSTDNTIKVAEDLGVRVVSRPVRGGAGAARATGVKAARGVIVAFIDSDCVAPADWLKKIADVFAGDPKIGAVGGMYRHHKAKSLVSVFGKFEEEFLHHNFALYPASSTLTGGNMAVRKSVWDEARSGRELIYFKNVASSEDTVVANEIRLVSKTFFTTDIFVNHMPKDDFKGFLYRNVRRARTRMNSSMLKLSKNGDNLLEAFGGFRLFWAAFTLWLIPLVALTGAFVEGWRWPATGVCVALALLHYILSDHFFKFVRTNDQRPYPVKVGLATSLGLRVLVALRAACWVIGSVLGVLEYCGIRLRRYGQIILSIAHFWRPGRISKMFYFVTSKCNARCEFCFNLENVVNWKDRQPLELTLPEVTQLAKSFGRLPFARKDLPEVVQAFYTHARTMWVTIPTNGALTKNVADGVFEILTTCPDIFLTIQFSVDSLNEAHDESRKIKGGFAAMVETAKRLSNLRRHYTNLRVQINTPYDTFNLHDIENIRNFCRENIDFDQQLFYMFREDGVLISKDNAHLADGFLDFIQRHDAEELASRGRDLWSRAVRALQAVTYEDTKQIKKHEKFVRPCYATQKFVTLYDDGTFAPCEVLATTSLGNIRNYDFDFYQLKREGGVNAYHRKEIIDTKCNCEWMCAPAINMLYDPHTWTRIAKNLIAPSTEPADKKRELTS
jgi:glycosyltransferase involved in cell wall biosynthesis/MoaA/NifB/PqqE/SkfB family radical SAM enzyme